MQTDPIPLKPATLVYADELVLEGNDVLLLGTIKEYITGIGYVRCIRHATDARKVTIEFEFSPFIDEPDDLWTMCERACEFTTELRAWGLNYTLDRTKVTKRRRPKVLSPF